jgi:RNA polymerase sigma-70 factor (ECF subfamily)
MRWSAHACRVQPALMSADPVELVRRIQARAPGAEEELVDRYTRGIAAILARCINDRSADDDIRQETLRLVIEKIRNGELREPKRLSGFVCNTARNLAIEYFRRQARRRPVDLEDAGPLAEPTPSPLDCLLREEQARLARKVLREMGTERYRQVLYRFYIAEEPKESICRRLGITSLNFNRILNRAKDRYRALYQEAMARHGKDD